MNTPSHFILSAKFPMPQEKILKVIFLALGILDVIFSFFFFAFGSAKAGFIVLLVGCSPYLAMTYIFKKMKGMQVILGIDRTITINPGFGKVRVHSVDNLSGIAIHKKMVRRVGFYMISLISKDTKRYLDEVPLPRFASEDVQKFFEVAKARFPELTLTTTPQN